MDTWALCKDCDRWFYCEGGVDESGPLPTCPVCGSRAAEVVNRALPPDLPTDAPPGARGSATA